MKRLKSLFSCALFLLTGVLTMISYSGEARAENVPRIVLDSYEIKSGSFGVGEKTTVRLHLKNTNAKAGAQNTLLTYSADKDLIYTSFGKSNQIFLGDIGASKTKDIDIELIVSSAVEQENVPLKFVADYVNTANGAKENNVFTINIPVNSLKITYNVSVASSTTVGGKTYIRATVANNGYSDLTNIKMSVVGKIEDDSKEEKDILAEEAGNTKTIKVNDVDAQESGYVEDSVVFLESGQQVVTVAFNYTDQNGEDHYEIAGEYTVNVIDRAKNTTTVEVAGASTTILWFVCIVIGVASVVVFVIVMIKKKKKGEISVDIIKDYVDKVRMRFK